MRDQDTIRNGNRLAGRRFRKTAKYKKYIAAYRKTKKYRDYKKAWSKTPKARAYMKKYHQTYRR